MNGWPDVRSKYIMLIPGPVNCPVVANASEFSTWMNCR